MEIERLTIRNFRGIRGEMNIEPEGRNLVLVGPNGSGKSSVIEAVDFLLKGKIETLTGEGSSGISLTTHGPHIDADLEDSWVEAEFTHEGESITVRRSFANRSNPEYEASDEAIKKEYAQVEETADRGLHHLSRDEILQFITSRGQTRSERIRSLLNVNHVKERRLVLNRAASHFEQLDEQKQREATSIREGLADLLDFEDYTEKKLLSAINDLRTELGGDAIDSLSKDEFRVDIESPSQRIRHSPAFSSDGRQYLDELQSWFSEDITEFLERHDEFVQAWSDFDPDEAAVRALRQRELLELGRDAIEPETEQCPLCTKAWDPDELEQVLNDRLEEADELSDKIAELQEIRSHAQQLLTNVRVQAESYLELLNQDEEIDPNPIEEFIEIISTWEDSYDTDLLDGHSEYERSSSELLELLRPQLALGFLESLESRIVDEPELDDIERVWEELRAAETRYLNLIETEKLTEQYEDAGRQVRSAHQAYIEAKNEVLGAIYTDVEGKFVEYYTLLHDDEPHLSAELSTTTAGLDFHVGFHERGSHPPHALHSEGHQDSMGICLHLALCDWLKREEIHPLVMLDDVVMSIDSEHRKPLANLLGSEISEEYQLLITTHDDLWHRHLRSAGVVRSSNVIRFVDWNIENGPRTMEQPEMEWETIHELLAEGKVPSAAFQTRRLSEWFLREACDQLDAKVRFDSDSNWTLGDFKAGATSRLSTLLGKAKQAEQSWGNDISHLNDLDDTLSELYPRIDQDGKALNPNIHWNEAESEFAHCSPSELRPAVDAYQELYQVFWCEDCQSVLSLSKEGNTPTAVRCRCQDINWNLQAQ